jgi:hypothetical protein
MGIRGPLRSADAGRFITNIGFANFVTAAVDAHDERIKGSCMVILEEGDQRVFDRGTPTRKMVHQLSWTGDPIFNLRICSTVKMLTEASSAINLDPNCGWARGKADVLYVADAFLVMTRLNALLAKK